MFALKGIFPCLLDFPIPANLPALFGREFINNLRTMRKEIYKRMPVLLRKYRRIRGLSQQQVARLLDHKNSSHISRWEKGECLPSLRNAIRLSIVYRMMIDGLFRDLFKQLREEIAGRENDSDGSGRPK